MSSNDWLQIVFVAAALILPISALAAHQLDWSKGIKLALVWVAIFAVVTLGISLVTGG